MFPFRIIRNVSLSFHLASQGQGAKRSLSAHQVSAALRPFYFAVHPDLFGQFPHERKVNENSLKQLNCYLESLLEKSHPGPATMVTFYLRDTHSATATTSPTTTTTRDLASQGMPSISLKLQSADLQVAVHAILSACQLPTDYIDTLIHKGKPETSNNSGPAPTNNKSRYGHSENIFWQESGLRGRGGGPGGLQETHLRDIEDRLKSVDQIDLSKWLKRNIGKAEIRAEAGVPVKTEIARLSRSILEALELNEIIWDCGWGVSHFRGCLQSFHHLAQQFPKEVSILKGRTLVFGRQTGVSLDGHIILSSDHVRHCWLELLESVPTFDVYLSDLPRSESNLSDVLLGMRIDHRKFQPTVLVEKYIHQVNKLTSALYKHRWQRGYPPSWPRRLESYQLVVEGESGPLMLSPTGQFIVPASCPAFLLVDFITSNQQLAEDRMKRYNQEKYREQDVCEETKKCLGLASLQKDDNVTPDLMIHCCHRLLHPVALRPLWGSILKGAHLRIANFYSVLQDGEICIPWNWRTKL